MVSLPLVHEFASQKYTGKLIEGRLAEKTPNCSLIEKGVDYLDVFVNTNNSTHDSCALVYTNTPQKRPVTKGGNKKNKF